MTIETFDPASEAKIDSVAVTQAQAIDGSDVVQISPAAAEKVASFLKEEGNPNLLLRVFVTGGGCSGFQYGFMFDEQQNEDDSVYTQHGIKMAIDSMSYQYLAGATVEYEETVAGSRFSINNPNATTTCGCGSSFSV
ncbi:iron-sulfur cluster insertion protein ErpA [Pseudomonas amygdali]|uniref:Iron-sulfur cluster insertion protein ErpA n=3 Tax=Pseudomonas syringae group genomosp. 2 TaxID=251698 RepID=A0ABR5KQN7_PSEAV|nr:iron-sulfur cluster insertion protein ErpA [Pseudomonas amygdali]AXH59427.1 iron-sulfur cluster insertion protein ErpA [Pseudomonas amygdali pv. lachrymans str. M301315]KPC16860.1 Iron-sulfur cluster insertion protein ErpA [Pseudomonas amygdali pv. lachrymans]KPC17819.1 Iron-sulfur cluster insertion protein ErpA [Pseudomonas amygdali pv. lachrymans]RMT06369.1 Iron-sulfur cluster insertion protein ErpA [Pseudomonas amygdali pv. lachrymans]